MCMPISTTRPVKSTSIVDLMGALVKYSTILVLETMGTTPCGGINIEWVKKYATK